ncbi:hypothetical protein SeLEV6574_g05407 [Synchytrium endobioticum]|uniref:40S ribosomal protein S12 n=1 Tax=Synchytrium endobioticum TaxID=286115 RepID=A0A507CV41_9FUNG|nr:hypothetical protein SeLEV6574_g05407 [Synchytrium endobioticum]
MADEEMNEEVVEVVEVAADASTGPMSVEDALQEVLKKALIHDGLARGLRECVKALDRRQAHLCVLIETCTETEYVKLVEALCKEHNINLIKLIKREALEKSLDVLVSSSRTLVKNQRLKASYWIMSAPSKLLAGTVNSQRISSHVNVGFVTLFVLYTESSHS